MNDDPGGKYESMKSHLYSQAQYFHQFKKVVHNNCFLLVYKQSFSERRSIGRRSERERKLTLVSALKMESYLPIFRKKNPSKSQ